jgi:hypothetical protein
MYDDPDPVRYPIRQKDDASETGWAMGALLVLLFVGAVFMFTRSDSPKIASSTAPDRPSTAAPAKNPPSTTGSGTTSPAPVNR